MNKPKLHLTSERNWMNDPNGLIYYKGKARIRQALFWIIFCHCEHEKDNLPRSGSRLPAPAAAPGTKAGG